MAEQVDRRELILARLDALIQTIPAMNLGILTVWRNRGELPEDKRPAISFLDGDEEVVSQPPLGRPQMSAQPAILVMRPEIYVVLDLREPKNENVGQDLNKYRLLLVNLILGDAQLRSLVTSNGSIRYEGCATDLASGRSMQGQLQVRIAFQYPFKPSELAAA